MNVQGIEARNGEEMIVAVGGFEGTGNGPEGEEAVINNIESLGFIAEMVLSRGRFLLVGVGGLIGVGLGLVGAGVVDIGSIGIAGSGEAAVLATGVRIAGAAFFAIFTGGTGTLRSRL